MIFSTTTEEEKKQKAILSLECNEDTFFLKRINCTEGQFTSEVNSNNSIWLLVKNFKSLITTEVNSVLYKSYFRDTLW